MLRLLIPPKVESEGLGRTGKFFVMSHIDLQSYYELNFALVQFHKYSLTEIENWIPWERDLCVTCLKLYRN